MEESEKRSRELQGEKVEGVLWVVDEVVDQRENPESLRLSVEVDEVYVDFLVLEFSTCLQWW